MKTGLLTVYRIRTGASSSPEVVKKVDIIFIAGKPPNMSIPNGSRTNCLCLGIACGYGCGCCAGCGLWWGLKGWKVWGLFSGVISSMASQAQNSHLTCWTEWTARWQLWHQNIIFEIWFFCSKFILEYFLLEELITILDNLESSIYSIF